MDTNEYRVESEAEVNTYLAQLRYALDSGATITFQEIRRIDENRNVKYTNAFVMSFHFAEKPFSEEVFPYRKGGAV